MNTEFRIPVSRSRFGFWGRLALDRFHRVFAVILLLQLIQCFRGYWWTETYSVVYGTLGAAIVFELLFTRWAAVRLALESLVAAGLSVAFAPDFHWIGWPDRWEDMNQWSAFFEAHVATLHPFIELGIGAVLAVHVLAGIGRTRAAMIAILVASIGAMAIVDSFFPLDLWRNIAWIVAAGLGWLVILHLRELRARHPDSWEALAERPIELILPAVLVIAALVIAGIIMPRAPAILEDPYTIWSEAQGRSVPSAAGDGGQLTNSSGVISGARNGSSSSGYSRDDRNLGGGFDFDYSPVMTVQTSRRSYWRGETKAVYTGKGWDDIRVRGPLTPLAAGADTSFGIPNRAGNARTETITQTVTLLRKDRIPVLFGAGPISRIDELKSDNNAGLQANREEWEVRFNKPARVVSYNVESEVTLLDREALRSVVNPAPASVNLAAYLQLPDRLPARVKNLAEQVVASGTNEYDKAALLEKYLKDNFAYNNKPDLSKRKSADFVDAFLFEIKEGYCDYYSTAFVVMARSVGIPARWVKGYASGVDPSKVESMRFGGADADPDGPGTYTVRNADAHSWAEVYFEGYGWIPFEPTSGFSVPMPEPARTLPAMADPLTEDLPGDGAGNAIAIDWRLPAAGGVLLLAAAAAVILLRKRRGVRLWKFIRYAGTTPDHRIVRGTERLVKFMDRRGLKREKHETMRESFRRWGDQFSSLRSDFDEVLRLFEQARYGREKGAEADANRFEETAARLRKSL